MSLLSGLDVVQTEITTFTLGHSIRQIFVKDIVYIPATQRSIQQLRVPITRAVQAIRVGMIHNVCSEFDYCAGV